MERSWGAFPGYTGSQPLYKGGRNPTRGLRDPFPRPTKDVAIDPKAHMAIDEGRRIYVGNLLYKLKLEDIQLLFADLADSIEDISMSIDPMTGRNPSYCFIDLVSRDLAERAILEYDGAPFKVHDQLFIISPPSRALLRVTLETSGIWKLLITRLSIGTSPKGQARSQVGEEYTELSLPLERPRGESSD